VARIETVTGHQPGGAVGIDEGERPFIDTSPVRALIGRIHLHAGQTRGPVSTDDQSTESTVDYLSLAWIRELSREVGDSATLRDLAVRHRIGVTQVVTDTPEGEVTYHLSIGDGQAMFDAGPADPEDVRMQQDWDTAVAVATGELNAQEAFVTGRILLFGDREALMGAHEVFAALDAVFSSVRNRTRYSR